MGDEAKAERTAVLTLLRKEQSLIRRDIDYADCRNYTAKVNSLNLVLRVIDKLAMVIMLGEHHEMDEG